MAAERDKTHGYVTEVTYPFNYYRELNPHIQALALTGAGIAAPTAPFAYIELGCGFGLGTLVHAAANPESRFVAVDINPDHIRAAAEIAAAAGLNNVDFRVLAFEDLASAGLPPFDFVAMHGVWSWINRINRDHILAFADRFLKPGGVLYSSYNAQPGYSAIMPLRELMMIGYRRARGGVPEKVEAGLAYGQRIKALEAAWFRANPLIGPYLDDIMPLARNYLAHEYFNADWWSYFFADVAADYTRIGLAYAGSAHILDNLDGWNFTADMRAALAELDDPIQRETLKDFFLNRQFRRDVFVRAPTRLPEGAAALRELPFAAAVLPANVHRVAGATLLGEVRPRSDIAEALATALADGPASIAVLMTRPAFAAFAPEAVLETILTMAALGAAEPARPAAGLAERTARCARLNRVLWERSLRGDEISATASPVTGGAVGLSKAEQLFLLARARGEDPVALVARAMPAQRPEAIAQAHAVFDQARIPLLRTLGIV
jgi:SAM-dependent methyltransferase